VCGALRGAMRTMDPKWFLRALVTSHSAAGDIHGALALVKASKEAELASGSARRTNGFHDEPAGSVHSMTSTTESHR
jgi:hypothetical protein